MLTARTQKGGGPSSAPALVLSYLTGGNQGWCAEGGQGDMKVRVVDIDISNEAAIDEIAIYHGAIWEILRGGATYVIVGNPDGSTTQYSRIEDQSGPGEWPEDP